MHRLINPVAGSQHHLSLLSNDLALGHPIGYGGGHKIAGRQMNNGKRYDRDNEQCRECKQNTPT